MVGFQLHRMCRILTPAGVRFTEGERLRYSFSTSSITCSLLHSRISLGPVLPGTEACPPSKPIAVSSAMKSFLGLTDAVLK